MNDVDVLYYCAVLFFCNLIRTSSCLRLSEVGGGGDGGGEREEGGANINIDD
jgi:hypothetical protein